MNNGTRALFALPALFMGIVVGWLILAGHHLVPGPKDLLVQTRQIFCPNSPGDAQNTGLKL